MPIKMNCHYYFKLGEGNSLFKHKNEGESLDLSIYFNNDMPGWKIEPFLKNGVFDEERFREKENAQKVSKTGDSQVPLFVTASLIQHRTSSFLWIFKHPKLYVFQPTDSVCDSEIDPKRGQTKQMPSICKKVFNMEDVPEFFASLNANQGYNRKTIRKFENSVHDIAEYLLFRGGEKLKVEPSRWFDFLSPVQFETLVFLIFHHAGAFCSTFRGGTRPDIDLMVEFVEPPKLPGFNSTGKFFLQVKMKTADVPKPNDYPPNEYLVWLGESDFEKRVLGLDWLTGQISKCAEVEKWLNRSLDFLTHKDA
jgi:hypothetical protein